MTRLIDDAIEQQRKSLPHSIVMLNMYNNDLLRKLIGFRLETDDDLEMYKWLLQDQINHVDNLIKHSIVFKDFPPTE